MDQTLLNLARLTGPPESVGRKNLTIKNLPPLVKDSVVKQIVAALVQAAEKATEFCLDRRNRRIAHLDLDLAANSAAIPLRPASKKQVADALDAISAAMNAVEHHYFGVETHFAVQQDSAGAKTLLHVLRDRL